MLDVNTKQLMMCVDTVHIYFFFEVVGTYKLFQIRYYIYAAPSEKRNQEELNQIDDSKRPNHELVDVMLFFIF